MKKVNKRKYRLPVRYINRNHGNHGNPRITPQHHKNSWEALNVMYKHYQLHRHPKQYDELLDLVGEANEHYHEGPLQWPFDLDSTALRNSISNAKNANFHATGGNWHGGYPFKPTHSQKYYWKYNNAIQKHFEKHLNFRNELKAWENVDNNILHKFRW